MNFRQLETFYWIAQLGQFGAAAARLNATQSTISTRIQELEASLGATVFDRSGRTVQLTDVGRALLPYAEEALSLARRIQENIVGHTPVAGLVRIGVGEIVALSWFPQMLAALSARHPALEVEVVVDLSVNLLRMLRTGHLDMGFVVGPAIGSEGIEITFASDVLESYQNMVTNHYAAKHYGVLRRSGRTICGAGRSFSPSGP